MGNHTRCKKHNRRGPFAGGSLAFIALCLAISCQSASGQSGPDPLPLFRAAVFRMKPDPLQKVS